jgi:hypothetical protein
MKNFLAKENLNQKTALLAFFWFSLVGFAFSLISAIVMASLHIETFGTMFTGENLYGDFLETISYVYSANPYTGATAGVKTIYLPFSFFILAPFAWLCHPVIERYFAGEVTIAYVHHEPRFLLTYFLFFAITITLILLLLWRMSGFHGKDLLFFLVACALDGSVLYAFGRANVILLAFLFVLIFFWLKDSPNKLLRELSYLALGCASAIKVYPAMFALIFIRERRFLDLLRTALYSAVLVFVPFLFVQGGFSNIPVFMENLAVFSRESRGLHINNVSMDAFIARTVFLFEKMSGANLSVLYKTLSYLFTGAVVVAVTVLSFFKKDEKNELAYLLLLFGGYVLFQTVSYMYIYIFFLVARILFLKRFDSLPLWQKRSYLFCLLVMSFSYLFFWGGGIAQQIAQMALFAFVFYDMVQSLRNKKTQDEATPKEEAA